MIFSDKQLLTIGGVVLVVGYLSFNAAKKGAAKLNPTNPDNVVRDGVNEFLEATTGQENPIGAIDNALFKVFATIDLINPFATDARKKFAKEELGL